MDTVQTPGRLRSQLTKVHTPACHDCHDDTTSPWHRYIQASTGTGDRPAHILASAAVLLFVAGCLLQLARARERGVITVVCLHSPERSFLGGLHAHPRGHR